MPEKTKHQLALDLVNENRLKEAASLLAEAIGEKENADLWNDWATVQVALDQSKEARAGYGRALELDPENAQAQFNLGALLLNQGTSRRAIELLQQCSGHVSAQEQAAIHSLLRKHKNDSTVAD
ncbi:MAG TPA: tetratricopeptide repeat protein, partial [Candidatus Angelobacter sp.]|nr:tetratricopeptide repeat protein [Candidatus Angelobacter sp.]